MDALAPAGVVVAFAGSTAPAGWLLCDGAEVDRTTYQELFAVIGTLHGSGDGVTTFNLPDYRGRFLRGVDEGAGRDPDAASRSAMNPGGNTGDGVGSVQGSAVGNHDHNFRNASGTANGGPGLILTQSGTGAPSNQLGDNGNSSGAVPFGGGPLISSESRPKNAYVSFLIKH